MNLDFVKFSIKNSVRKTELVTDFVVSDVKDIMVKGKSFYAFWDEDNNIWSMDEMRLTNAIDKMGLEECNIQREKIMKFLQLKSRCSQQVAFSIENQTITKHKKVLTGGNLSLVGLGCFFDFLCAIVLHV